MRDGFRHYNKKLKGRPKLRKQPRFKMRDRVRHLTKYSTDVNQKFYKSYSSGRNKHTAIWSKLVFTVQGKRTRDRMPQYQLSNMKWYWPYELQLIPYGVKKLQIDIPKKVQAPRKPKTKVIHGQPSKKVYAELDPRNIRRGKRVRKSRFSSLKF